MSYPVISVKNLKKIYKKYGKTPFPKKFKALHDITFDVYANEIFGFLGQNGAGKTTTIKILMQLMPYNDGRISILGKAFPDLNIQKDIGFLPELPYFYDFLSLREMLNLYGNFFDIDRSVLKKRIDYLIDLVGLKDRQDTRMGEYSKGMLQRSGLAQALINDPKILILDEPLSGLDPIGRKELREIIISQKQAGKTIMFSSHILQDAEMICDRIAIVKNGIVDLQGSIKELIPPVDDIFEIHLMRLNKSQIDSLKEYKSFTVKFTDNYGNMILKTAYIQSIDEIIDQISHIKENVYKISKITPTLEDLYIERTRNK